MADPIPETKTIPLRKPVKLGNEIFAELQLFEPTAGQLEESDALVGAAADIRIVSLVSGIPEGVIRKIGARDLYAASGYLALFLDEEVPVEPVDELTIPLRKSIVEDGKTHAELNLHEPLAGELEKIGGLKGRESDIALVASVSGLKPATVRQLGVRNFLHAKRYLDLFFD